LTEKKGFGLTDEHTLQRYDIQHNDIQHNDTQHNNTQDIGTLNTVMVNVYAECCN
jgi:hypothetical protein